MGPKHGNLGLELLSTCAEGLLSLDEAGGDADYLEASADCQCLRGPLCSFFLTLGFPFPHQRHSEDSLEV